jgi:hypothetical protein
MEALGSSISSTGSRDGRSEVDLRFVETIILLCKQGERFELGAGNHGKSIASKGFLHARKIGVMTPIVHFMTEGVALSFECAKF